LQKQQVLMLMDSGISHCFVSGELAASLQGFQRARDLVRVKVADGGELLCDREIVGCEWWCQGATFSSNFKVLLLGGYDVIIGMDWLQSHNPMGLDWLGKRMAFWDNGKMIILTGIRSKTDSCKQVDTRVLINMLQQAMVANVIQVQQLEATEDTPMAVPPEIDAILIEFAQVFAKPDGLPPSHPFDHSIPLVPGAKPVNVRPYRYSLAQKDEIEKQIAEML
jgi:hypothetical protein